MIKRRGQSRRKRIRGNSLWWYRKRMGFTQREAAQIIGCPSRADISRFEHGARVPGLLTALKLEILYRAPVAFLFSDLYADLKAAVQERETRFRKHSPS